MKNYLNFGRLTQITPQTEPIPGSSQSPNNAGGWSWTVDDHTRLQRFLILGSSSSTLYVGQRELTKQNLEVVERMLKEGKGHDVVTSIVEISKAGRAISNDPALFALARCCACDVHGKVKTEVRPLVTHTLHRENHPDFFERFPIEGEPMILHNGKDTFVRYGDSITHTVTRPAGTIIEEDHPDDVAIRQYAFSVLPQVARTGTHLLHFVAYVKQFRGWSKLYKRSVASWFHDRREHNLAYQVLKYQNRDGYSQRDLLRLAHPKAETSTYNTIYHWITKGWESVGDEPHPDPALQIIWAYERAKHSQDEREVASLIKEYKLPREAVPTQHLHSSRVWEALLEDMPMEAMTRNLATMTREGVLKPMGAMTKLVASRLRDKERVHAAKLHPIKILAALTTYAQGHGVRSQQTWEPVREVIDALNDAFYLSFEAVEPTGKRILFAIDTSGSMHYGKVNGIPGMDVHTAAGAMAMVMARTEPDCQIIGVDTGVQRLTISPTQRLDDVVKTLKNSGGGGTDLSLPMKYALYDKSLYDAFVIFTDSETWAGRGHPAQILEMYRAQVNPNVRLINVQMTATHVTNNAPDDRRAIECVGFDPNCPTIISSFIRGEL